MEFVGLYYSEVYQSLIGFETLDNFPDQSLLTGCIRLEVNQNGKYTYTDEEPFKLVIRGFAEFVLRKVVANPTYVPIEQEQQDAMTEARGLISKLWPTKREEEKGKQGA